MTTATNSSGTMIYVAATADTTAHCELCSRYDYGRPLAVLLVLVLGAVLGVLLMIFAGRAINMH